MIASCAWAETITGRVVGVADGDTITVLDAANQQHKIRLSGIDCPEKNQPFGQVAKQSMSDQVFDRQVSVETSKRDRYGREIGKVLVGGVDANLEQLRRGLAWHYKKYEREQGPLDRATYAGAEIEARVAGRGLWVDPEPMAPWDWRKK
jgi:endonuclease YncB( thermonuclease family)